MRMRLKPRRGEKRTTSQGVEVQILEEIVQGGQVVKVLLPNGKTDVVTKDDLDLPIIDTKDYEKLDAMA